MSRFFETNAADPLEYNRDVDDKLELDTVLKPSAAVTNLLSSIDRTKVKTWILTNAYVTHAKRVLKLLDIERFFEGVFPTCSPLLTGRRYVL
jgi:FMN phosphatase YigB (HAD superfamily)